MREIEIGAAILFATQVRPIVVLACNAGAPYHIRSQLRERSDSVGWSPLEAEDFCLRAIARRVKAKDRQKAAWARLKKIAAGKATFAVVADEREAQEISDAETAVRAIYADMLHLRSVR